MNGSDMLKTILITIGIILAAMLTVICYACIIVGSETERQMGAWERDHHAGRD